MEDHETGTTDEDEACIEKELHDKTLNDNNDYDISFSHGPLTVNLLVSHRVPCLMHLYVMRVRIATLTT
jgi:hypothetical protein